jgi:ssDNA-binding Zn-finger/Zn-ribbon topoisomerase 1
MKMTSKPTGTEEEYFARKEYERLKKSQEESQKNLANDQRTKEKELHYMKCPKCGMNLVEIDYKKIKVDKCSECEGIWLDAGELEMVGQMDKGSLDKLFSVFSRGD